jgi:hypothetical protein
MVSEKPVGFFRPHLEGHVEADLRERHDLPRRRPRGRLLERVPYADSGAPIGELASYVPDVEHRPRAHLGEDHGERPRRLAFARLEARSQRRRYGHPRRRALEVDSKMGGPADTTPRLVDQRREQGERLPGRGGTCRDGAQALGVRRVPLGGIARLHEAGRVVDGRSDRGDEQRFVSRDALLRRVEDGGFSAFHRAATEVELGLPTTEATRSQVRAHRLVRVRDERVLEPDTIRQLVGRRVGAAAKEEREEGREREGPAHPGDLRRLGRHLGTRELFGAARREERITIEGTREVVPVRELFEGALGLDEGVVRALGVRRAGHRERDLVARLEGEDEPKRRPLADDAHVTDGAERREREHAPVEHEEIERKQHLPGIEGSTATHEPSMTDRGREERERERDERVEEHGLARLNVRPRAHDERREAQRPRDGAEHERAVEPRRAPHVDRNRSRATSAIERAREPLLHLDRELPPNETTGCPGVRTGWHPERAELP